MDRKYHEDREHLSNTALKLFDHDPLIYYHTWVETPPSIVPDEPEDHVDFGSAAHDILLHFRPIDEVVVAYPESCINKNGGLIGLSAEKFRLNNADRICMKDEDIDRLLNVIEKVRTSQLGPLLEDAHKHEEPMYWEELGIKCRMKPDFFYNLPEKTVNYDLKFSEDISDIGFSRSAEACKWWLQDVHYSAGAIILYEKPSEFRFWSVESKFPYRIFERSFPPRDREIAMKRRRRLLLNLLECRKTGDWSAKWDHMASLRTTWQEMVKE